MATRTGKNEAVNEKIGQHDSIGINELGDHKHVEQAVENDINGKDFELEKFMNEFVEILVHPTSDPYDHFPLPNCNGINQPIIRGVPIKVRRKYVEILARCRKTHYEQQVHNPAKPENIQMIPTVSLVFPFSVRHDPNPLGKEWLDQILAQPD